MQTENDVPEICRSCGNYLPQFYRVINKECAAFGTCRGVKDNACGAWCRRIAPEAYSWGTPKKGLET